jgi:hypothetical protein
VKRKGRKKSIDRFKAVVAAALTEGDFQKTGRGVSDRFGYARAGRTAARKARIPNEAPGPPNPGRAMKLRLGAKANSRMRAGLG